MFIDGLQYCNWSKEIFEINREANLDAVHATICYHEDYDELQINIDLWKKYFENYYGRIIENEPFSLQTQSHESKDYS